VNKTLAVLLGGIWAIGATSASLAAPRAESAMECGIAADMAVVAHSLAAERLEQAKAGAIMARIYDVAASQRGKELMDDILNAAYRSNDSASAGGTAETANGQKFAENLFAVCMKTGGSMDEVLGQKS
jgi:hypothetical protein